MPKPEYEFHTPTAQWTPIDGEARGISECILSTNDETGDYTRLLRFDAGADSTPNGMQVHDFWEEVFIVSGDLTDQRIGATFTSGMYACRPPGMEHGPWRSQEGVLMIEFRSGMQT